MGTSAHVADKPVRLHTVGGRAPAQSLTQVIGLLPNERNLDDFTLCIRYHTGRVDIAAAISYTGKEITATKTVISQSKLFAVCACARVATWRDVELITFVLCVISQFSYLQFISLCTISQLRCPHGLYDIIQSATSCLFVQNAPPPPN